MKLLEGFVFVALVLAMASAHARGVVPLANFENQKIVTSTGKPAAPQAVREAIVRAGTAGARKWDIAPTADGKTLLATTRWEDHMLVVRIEPAAETYSVRYADSVNLKYSIKDGQPAIHPAYNKLVGELVRTIAVELLKL